MPSTATITSFVTMVAGTRARANHVNNNFDNFRGHLIPINTDTATASHQTHDLGSSDHQWRRIYVKEAPFVNGVQAGRFEIPIVLDGSEPVDAQEYDNYLDRTSFAPLRTTGVIFNFVVPSNYTPGNRISLALNGFCETVTSQFAMELGSALYKASLTSMMATAPANVLTSTASISPALANVFFTNTSLRVTDSSGRINLLTVTAGDVISCYLKRRGEAVGDTNTGFYHLTNLEIDLNN